MIFKSFVLTFAFMITCSLFMHPCNARTRRLGLASSSSGNQHAPSLHQKINEYDYKARMNFTPSVRNRVLIASELKKKNGENSGNKDVHKPSLHDNSSHDATKPEGSKSRLNTSEKISNSSIFKEEYWTETDYQPPRRKSPIHNK